MLFSVSTHGHLWNIVLDVGPDSPYRGEKGSRFKFWGPLLSSERLKRET